MPVTKWKARSRVDDEKRSSVPPNSSSRGERSWLLFQTAAAKQRSGLRRKFRGSMTIVKQGRLPGARN